jgi:hypothetical protein
MSMIAIKDIIIGERHRHDMGDLAALAASIEAVGLLHPPVVDKNNVLVAGERRIRAALLLGWTDIQVTVVDIAEIVLGEYAENEVRKDFTLSEAVAIKRLVEPAIVAEAKANSQANLKRGDEAARPANIAGRQKGDARDVVAKRTGKSRTTLAKAEKVVEAAEAEPEKFAPLVEEMDRTGKADGPYKQLAASKASPADAVKATADRAAIKTPKPVADVTAAADRAAKSWPADSLITAARLTGVLDQVVCIDEYIVFPQMTDDESVEVMEKIARSDVRLNEIAIRIARGGGARLGALAPLSLLQPALKFLKEAVTRIEAELVGRASPADSKPAET